jgi:GT2 family glycosyltransferase
MRKSILDEIGGFRLGFEGSQDHDLFLRFTENTNEIYHISKILYHWRIHEKSTASNSESKSYSQLSGKKAVQESLDRQEIDAIATDNASTSNSFMIKPILGSLYEKVSIIIPTKDKANVLKTCIDSIIEKATYSNYEILVINNQSSEASFFSLMDSYQEILGDKFRLINADFEFNFSSLINLGAEESKGEHLLLLNNDTEIISPNFLEDMLLYSKQKNVGAVGTKLLFSNQKIQHAGVVFGVGGVANHVFVRENRDTNRYFSYAQCVQNYSAVTAACLMIEKAKFEVVKGFEKELEVEFNDVDFCLKLRKEGYLNVYLPNVELFHYESFSRGNPHATEKGREMSKRAHQVMERKWISEIIHDPFYNCNLSRNRNTFTLRLLDNEGIYY